jgi:hypothetical protein
MHLRAPPTAWVGHRCRPHNMGGTPMHPPGPPPTAWGAHPCTMIFAGGCSGGTGHWCGIGSATAACQGRARQGRRRTGSRGRSAGDLAARIMTMGAGGLRLGQASRSSVPVKQLVDRCRTGLHLLGGRRAASALNHPTADEPPLPRRRPVPGQHVTPGRMAPPPGSRGRYRVDCCAHATSNPGHPASPQETDPSTSIMRPVTAQLPCYSEVRRRNSQAARGAATTRMNADHATAASTGCCIGHALIVADGLGFPQR